jgi:hypothetical protein
MVRANLVPIPAKDRPLPEDSAIVILRNRLSKKALRSRDFLGLVFRIARLADIFCLFLQQPQPGPWKRGNILA